MLNWRGLKHVALGLFVLLAAGALTLPASATPTVSTIYNFNTSYSGNNGNTLALGPDGTAYGTTSNGGEFGYGTIYAISPAGVVTTLHSFDGYNDGSNQNGGMLTYAPDGNLYGTCFSGGTGFSGVWNSGFGTVYRITTNGVFSVLHTFAGGSDGQNPRQDIIVGVDGNLYGISIFGAANGSGAIFEVTGDTISDIYSFTGQNAMPQNMTQGQDGNFYCASYDGGANGYGAIFEAIPGIGVEYTLYNFTGSEGGVPFGPIIQGQDGNLYGVISVEPWFQSVSFVAPLSPSGGAVYELQPGTGQLNIIHAFSGPEGYDPNLCGLSQGPDGSLYGATTYGGPGFNGSPWTGSGVVFKMNTDGSNFTDLYSFGGSSDGAGPGFTPTLAPDGSIYGATASAGTFGQGTAWKIAPDNSFTALTSLGATAGDSPQGNMIQGADGAFYGTTFDDSSVNWWPGTGNGTIYRLAVPGGYTVLHQFSGTDGSHSFYGLVQGPDGAYYGTTEYGGPAFDGTSLSGSGVVFRIDTSGNYTVIHAFQGLDGSLPAGSLIVGNNGMLYGSTIAGGANNLGTLFEISTDGSTFNSLYSFTGPDGQNPVGSLMQTSDGTLYGSAEYGGLNGYGTVFKFAGGSLTTLYSFFGSSDGAYPITSLTMGPDGFLYGAAEFGGMGFLGYWPSGTGSLFKIAPDGTQFTVLHSFAGGDGQIPESAPILASDGNFYGVTSAGGPGYNGNTWTGDGVVYELTPAGAFTVVSTQNGGVQSLIQANDGALYGVSAFNAVNPTNGFAFKVDLGLTPPNTAPLLYAMTPSTAAAGSPDTSITVTGSQFDPGAVISFNGDPLPTTVYSSGEAVGAIPAADLANSGDYAVTVVDSSSIASNSLFFEVDNPAPSVTSVSPSSAIAGTSSTLTVAVYGSGFNSSSEVDYNGNPLPTTFVSATEVDATIDPSLLTIAEIDGISVFNPAPGGAESNTVEFDVDNPVPTVASINPASTLIGSPNLTITLTGSGYEPDTTVYFDGNPLVTTLVSATQVQAVIPAADMSFAEAGQVTVTNLSPGGGTTAPFEFDVDNPSPTLTSVSPTTILAGSTGVTLTVNGSNFVIDSTVLWNGAALSTTYVSATQLQATVPNGDVSSTGTASVSVQNNAPGGGTSTSATVSIINPTPVLTSISPSSVTQGSADFTLTATGSNFVPASLVLLNGSPLSTTYVSSTSLQATVPAADVVNTGNLSISVQNPAPGGTSGSKTLKVNPLAISTFTLSSGSVISGGANTGTITLTGPAPAGGFVVSLTSSNTSAATVPATATVLATQSTVQFTVNTLQVSVGTSVKITVTAGASSKSATFTVNPIALSGFTLTSASVIGGTGNTATITINAPAPSGGLSINLSSDNPAAASVPATATIAANTNSVQVAFPTYPVLANTSVKLTATLGSSTKTATLTVKAAALSKVTLSPTSIAGGGTVNGTLTLTGPAASGYVVNLSSSNSAVASPTQATVTVAANATTASFTVSTTAVAANTTASIAGVDPNGTSQKANLTVDAPVFSAFTISPSSVKGGVGHPVLTITLSSAAPAGGTPVTLTSNNAAVVVSNTSVPAGSTSTTVTLSPTSVTKQQTVTLTAVVYSVTKKVTLTVTP